MSLTGRAVGSYLIKKKDPKYANKTFSSLHGIAVINKRPLLEPGLTNSISKYQITGENSNEIYIVPTEIPIRNVTTKSMSNVFEPYKYGALPRVFAQTLDFAGIFPYGVSSLVNIVAKSVTIAFSNFIGPTELLPIPGQREKSLVLNEMNYNTGTRDISDENKRDVGSMEATEEEMKTGKFKMDLSGNGNNGVGNNNNISSLEENGGLIMNKEYVDWIYGTATPSVAAMLFTFCTYNNAARLGVLTDTNCVENPKELVQCFMEEWQNYEAEAFPNGYNDE